MLERFFRPSPPLPDWVEYGALAAAIMIAVLLRPPLPITILIGVAYVGGLNWARRIVAARSRGGDDDPAR
jgi:hypothetical protein